MIPGVQIWKDEGAFFARITPKDGKGDYQFEVAKDQVPGIIRNWLKIGFTVRVGKPADLQTRVVYDISEH